MLLFFSSIKACTSSPQAGFNSTRHHWKDCKLQATVRHIMIPGFALIKMQNPSTQPKWHPVPRRPKSLDDPRPVQQACCKEDPADRFHESSQTLHIFSFSPKRSDSIISVHSGKYALRPWNTLHSLQICSEASVKLFAPRMKLLCTTMQHDGTLLLRQNGQFSNCQDCAPVPAHQHQPHVRQARLHLCAKTWRRTISDNTCYSRLETHGGASGIQAISAAFFDKWVTKWSSNWNAMLST